jgi:hypothetical protein
LVIGSLLLTVQFIRRALFYMREKKRARAADGQKEAEAQEIKTSMENL